MCLCVPFPHIPRVLSCLNPRSDCKSSACVCVSPPTTHRQVPPCLAQTLTHVPTNTHLTDAYYTPEGERKRILALPIEEGREYFETREAFLTYVIKHMTAYYEAKEKGSERRLKELVTPGTSFSLQLFDDFSDLPIYIISPYQRLGLCHHGGRK